MAVNPDPDLTVTMPKSHWAALLSVEPFVKETYTDQGVAIFTAYRQVRDQTGIGGVQ